MGLGLWKQENWSKTEWNEWREWYCDKVYCIVLYCIVEVRISISIGIGIGIRIGVIGFVRRDAHEFCGKKKKN